MFVEEGTAVLWVTVAISDGVAMVGFPMADTDAGSRAGVVYIYEYIRSLGRWEKVKEPLIPYGGGGYEFGGLVNLHGNLAVRAWDTT